MTRINEFILQDYCNISKKINLVPEENVRFYLTMKYTTVLKCFIIRFNTFNCYIIIDKRNLTRSVTKKGKDRRKSRGKLTAGKSGKRLDSRKDWKGKERKRKKRFG